MSRLSVRPSMRRITALTALLLALVLGSVVAACSDGGDDTGGDDTGSADTGSADADTLAAAVDATAEEITYDFDLRFGLSLGPQSTDFRLVGALDQEERASEITAEIDGQEVLELRIVDGEAYLRSDLPEIADALPPGKEWASGSVEELTEQEVIQPIEDDVALVYLLLGASNVEAEGTEEVDGVEVTKYSFDIDLEDAIAEAPDDRRAEVEELMTTTGDTGIEVTGEVWLDSEDRIVRMTAQGELSSADRGPATDLPSPTGEITYDLTHSEFGEEVNVSPPPEEEVVPLDDVPGLIERFKDAQRADQ